MLVVLLLVGVFVTSVLSGIAGMAGGVVLLALLILTLPTYSAMVLHGLIQAMANGSRVWFIRDHVQWHLIPSYFIGVLVTGVIFWWAQISWSAPVILIAIGLFSWLPVLIPNSFGLDITRKPVAMICGIATTVATLLAGTSGPLLDVFFQTSKLTRFEIVATKAFTQTISHLVKIAYFLWLTISLSKPLHELVGLLYVIAFLLTSLIGTKIGTMLLKRINETNFQRMSRILIMILGTAVGISGIMQLQSGQAWIAFT
ncbi:MAG: TSUP family transporter [Gammaproteobacteria bacterium]|nr:TSUP family transporter [Gammaproteobacteria bacterium]